MELSRNKSGLKDVEGYAFTPNEAKSLRTGCDVCGTMLFTMQSVDQFSADMDDWKKMRADDREKSAEKDHELEYQELLKLAFLNR